jgi:hypothetical protein
VTSSLKQKISFHFFCLKIQLIIKNNLKDNLIKLRKQHTTIKSCRTKTINKINQQSTFNAKGKNNFKFIVCYMYRILGSLLRRKS